MMGSTSTVIYASEHGSPFRGDESRRVLRRCELDAAYAINRDSTAYILDTLPIARRKDEATYGEYRTKRVILETFDEFRRAIESGSTCVTRPDPPLADSRCGQAAKPPCATRDA